VIRPAVAADAHDLIELIRELARYEREPDAVRNDADALTEALFGPSPLAHASVAEDSGKVVGCAIWFVSYSTWTGRHGIYLEDLVVAEAHRRSGHGRALMGELAGICRDRGYARLEWSVLDWNAPALRMYRSLGAEAMSEWTIHRLDGAALSALARPASE
jgi:GNAT superfamily N-acetyltransferase